MKVLPLTVACSAAVSLVGYAVVCLPIVRGTESVADSPTPLPTAAQEAYAAALRLGWEASVDVQAPKPAPDQANTNVRPLSIHTWRHASVKWRKAVRLLESIPEQSDESVAAKKRLPTYRANYRAIRDRLAAEQAAAAQLEEAQTKAEQALRIVQVASPTLRRWQRAHQKWQQAIALLVAAPAQTSRAAEIQRHLQDYRRQQGVVQQRLATETQTLGVLRQFAAASMRLKVLSERALAAESLEQGGMTDQDYALLVGRLEQALARLAQLERGKAHPAYAELATTLQDYKIALKLWQSHTAYQESEPYFPLVSVPQLVPISHADSVLLTQRYNLKTYLGGTKISLRFAVWEIWRQAGDRIGKAQQKALGIRPV